MKDYKDVEELISTLENIEDISSENEVELSGLILKAKDYLARQKWCNEILSGWLSMYWDGVLAVFLFKINPLSSDIDDYVWIAVGDLPTAYIDVESAKNTKDVLECYVFIMSDWAENLLAGNSLEESYPVEAPPTKKYGEMLKGRLDIIKDFIKEEL
ncbi:MAG: DUF4826 family protein [Bacteroidota bacterium]